MMVAQLKVSRALGVIGLWNVLGVQGLWMGPMPVAGGLVERQDISCNSGSVACGDNGCLAETRCCNPLGWACTTGAACYTVSGTVDCYRTSTAAPTTARSCFDYTATDCQEATGCFKCVSTDFPYCLTKRLQGSTDLWIECSTLAGTVTLVAPSTTKSTTPRSTFRSISSISDPSDTLVPSITGLPAASSTASVSPSPTGSHLSGGAIAGIAIGAFIAIAIIGFLAFLLLKKPKNTQTQAAHMGDATYPQPPLPPHSPYTHEPQYQPVMGQTVGSPVYQDHYPNDQALKAQHQAPHPPPAELS